MIIFLGEEIIKLKLKNWNQKIPNKKQNIKQPKFMRDPDKRVESSKIILWMARTIQEIFKITKI